MAAQVLTGLRELMKAAGLTALIVPSADPHNSEYVAPRYERRAFLSNFHGSAGTCVVTQKEALLWTDGRYYLEAGACLSSDWTLMKDGLPETPTVEAWLSKAVKSDPVGIDAFQVTMTAWDRMSRLITLKGTSGNLVDQVWKDCPPLSVESILVHEEKFAGKSVVDKVGDLCAELKEAQCQVAVFTALDDIAWLLNLRCTDVEYNPVFYAYLVVEVDAGTATLCVDKKKITTDVTKALGNTVKITEYNDLGTTLKSLKTGDCVQYCGVDENQVSEGVRQLITDAKFEIKKVKGFIQYKKGIKNPTELAGFYDSHRRDGAALTKFLAWLDAEIRIKRNPNKLTEVDVSDKLEGLRKEVPLFRGLSFGTISGSGPNGAVIHYHAKRPTDRVLDCDKLYLVDSGGQYSDGTTDVTRTVCFDAPTDEERECYTLVLKGHIAINACKFPQATTGHRIDAMARHALWQQGLNYAHGTGHGVGSFLNVHEGPHGIGTRPTANGATLQEGMIVSNEPGFYKDGAFGIRIENLEAIVKAKTKYNDGTFLTFDYLTMAPLCPSLINTSLLTANEIQWVDRYHAKVGQELTPLLKDDEFTLKYLQDVTKPLK